MQQVAGYKKVTNTIDKKSSPKQEENVIRTENSKMMESELLIEERRYRTELVTPKNDSKQ